MTNPNHRPCELAPPEAFSNELAPADLLARLRPHAEPAATRSRSATVSLVFASRCCGERRAATAPELYAAMRRREPNERDLDVLTSWLIHATPEQQWWAWVEQAYSWRMLARAMQLTGLPFWERHRIMNMHAYDQSLVPKSSLPTR